MIAGVIRIKTIDDIAKLIEGDPWRMEVLRCVDGLMLPDYAIGAGFVRAAVWDKITNKPTPTSLDDIDALYFDAGNLGEEVDKQIERQLRVLMPSVPWSVKNQARMHLRNGDEPYHNTEHAISFWLETPTCVAARLDKFGNVTLIAPHGIDDLINLRVRPTRRGREKFDQYIERVTGKNWLKHWPNLVIET